MTLYLRRHAAASRRRVYPRAGSGRNLPSGHIAGIRYLPPLFLQWVLFVTEGYTQSCLPPWQRQYDGKYVRHLYPESRRNAGVLDLAESLTTSAPISANDCAGCVPPWQGGRLLDGPAAHPYRSERAHRSDPTDRWPDRRDPVLEAIGRALPLNAAPPGGSTQKCRPRFSLTCLLTVARVHGGGLLSSKANPRGFFGPRFAKSGIEHQAERAADKLTRQSWLSRTTRA
jgi:hypothetical protein